MANKRKLKGKQFSADFTPQSKHLAHALQTNSSKNDSTGRKFREVMLVRTFTVSSSDARIKRIREPSHE